MHPHPRQPHLLIQPGRTLQRGRRHAALLRDNQAAAERGGGPPQNCVRKREGNAEAVVDLHRDVLPAEGHPPQELQLQEKLPEDHPAHH